MTHVFDISCNSVSVQYVPKQILNNLKHCKYPKAVKECVNLGQAKVAELVVRICC